MSHTNLMSIGQPRSEHRHRTLRAAASIVAALAGALGVMITAFAVVGGASTGTWIAAAVLFAIAATGIWWRWDSPDARDPHYERERRGF